MLDSEIKFVYSRDFIFNRAFPKLCSVIVGFQKAFGEYNGCHKSLVAENYEKTSRTLFFIQNHLLELSQRLGSGLDVSIIPEKASSLKLVDEERIQLAYNSLIAELYPHSPIVIDEEKLQKLFKNTMSFFDLLFDAISFYSENAIAQKPESFGEQLDIMKKVCASARLYKKIDMQRDLFANAAAKVENAIANVCYDLIYTSKRRFVVPEVLLNSGERLAHNLGYFLYYNTSVRMLDLSGFQLTRDCIQKLRPALITPKNVLEDLRLASCALDDISFADLIKAIRKRNRKKIATKIDTLVVDGNNLTSNSAALFCKGLKIKTLTISFAEGFIEACDDLLRFARKGFVERITLPQRHILNKPEVQMQLILEYKRESDKAR